MKLERLMAITMLLLNRKRVQAQELAERLEVSLRTIYRDMESLSLSGIPIVSHTGTDGGFEIMEGYRLDRQMLTYDELTALITALRGLQSTQAMDRLNMDRLLQKVGALVSQAEQGRLADREHIHIDFTPWKNSESERNKYDALLKAVQDNKLVSYAYTDGQGGDTKRRIEPIGLVLRRYDWYLQGYCLDREDYRTFKLSRIRDLYVLEDSFQRRNVALSNLNERWKAPGYTETIDLVLRCSGESIASVADHFDESELERLPDDSIMVRTTLPNEKWVIGFLLHFKSDVLVLEPAYIAAEVRRIALEISALYRDSGQRSVMGSPEEPSEE
ncbi:helix-turn-helix transcriptional regulator [Paenibacillus sepulcri]|uniref:helix-turn-helix transcriptional regulator n=1 Tax=Paenibacillus sepulcri TaxID=359917 RepID=UPI001AE91B6D